MIIDVQNVSKEYKTKGKTIVKALDDVSYAVNEGDAVGLIGMNGAGKSTTIKLLTGILKPTSGEIHVMGMNPLENRKKLCHAYGVMFGQRSQLWWDLPARDSFFINGSIYGLSKKQVEYKLDFYKDVIDISYINVPVRQLSLGQKMVCDILLSMLHDPKLLFLDEATIALDVYNRKQILKMISTFNKDFGITLIITSHLLGDIESVCDKVLLLNRGSLYYNGSLKNFLSINKMCKTITVSYKNMDILQKEMSMFQNSFEIQASAEGNILTLFCREEQGLINKILSLISSNEKVEEFSIRNVTLEERMLSMEGQSNV